MLAIGNGIVISSSEQIWELFDGNCMTCLCDLIYVNICMMIYLHVLYENDRNGIMHLICTRVA